MTEATVKAEDLVKEYEGGFVGVEDISFEVDEGQVLGIIGPNGAGKTTTLKMIAGLVNPTEGSVDIKGSDVTDKDTRRDIGFLPEESPVYDKMTARSYLRFFADLYNVDRETADERIEQTLEELDLDYVDKKIGDLSKGMTRKVLISRSLINDPDVLVYDEPASGLDPYTTNYIVNYVEKQANQGKSIVFSAHNLYHVESLCDRVLIVEDGEVVASGSINDIKEEFGEPKYEVVSDVRIEGSEEEADGNYVKQVKDSDKVDSVREDVNEMDGEVLDVYKVEPSLEQIFLDIIDTGDKNEE